LLSTTKENNVSRSDFLKKEGSGHFTFQYCLYFKFFNNSWSCSSFKHFSALPLQNWCYQQTYRRICMDSLHCIFMSWTEKLAYIYGCL